MVGSIYMRQQAAQKPKKKNLKVLAVLEKGSPAWHAAMAKRKPKGGKK